MQSLQLTSESRSLRPPTKALARSRADLQRPLQFLLFIIVTATLFIRPAEIIPELDGLPIYQFLNLACLAAALPLVLKELSLSQVRRTPITACVLGLLAAVVLSQLAHLRINEAALAGLEFLKAVIYYLFLVAIIDSYARLRALLLSLIGFVLVVSLLSVLHANGIINLPAFEPECVPIDGQYDPISHEHINLLRLCGAGIFANSNDLSRIVIVAMFIALWQLMEPGAKHRRWLWALPLVFLLYVLQHTYSRGGFLAFCAGGALLFWLRYGWFKSTLLLALLLPLILVVFAGRQLELDASSGTGQQRIRLWAGGLLLFRSNPIFGIGIDQYEKEMGLVAHNSFLQCFTELGFFGGTLFLASFVIASVVPVRLRFTRFALAAADPRLLRLRPYVLAIIVATVVGMLTSTRSYNIPTYAILGIATVLLRLLEADHLLTVPRVTSKLLVRMCAWSLLFLLLLFTCVNTMVRWH